MVFQPTTETGSEQEHGKIESEWRAGQRIVLSLFLLSLIAICLYFAYESRELSAGDVVASGDTSTSTTPPTSTTDGPSPADTDTDEGHSGPEPTASTTSTLVATSSARDQASSTTEPILAASTTSRDPTPEVSASETTLNVADQRGEAKPTTSVGLPQRGAAAVVTLYSERNFTGRSWVLRPGEYADEIYASPLGGKPALSIEVEDGLRVRLCEKAGGAGTCITVETTTASLAEAAVIDPLAYIEVSES